MVNFNFRLLVANFCLLTGRNFYLTHVDGVQTDELHMCKWMELRLITSDNELSKNLFSSLAIEDIYQISIVQQCKVLENLLETSVLAQCLSHPHDAPRIVREHPSINETLKPF